MLYAKHHILSSWCRIFNSRSRSRKIRILSISKLFFFIFVLVISILLRKKKAFWQTSILNQSIMKLCSDWTGVKSLLMWLKNIGMVSEKLYRNTLNIIYTKNNRIKFYLLYFSSWWKIATHLGWSLLDLTEGLSPLESTDSYSETLAQLLFAAYLVFALIILINMLIALLSNTYQRVQVTVHNFSMLSDKSDVLSTKGCGLLSRFTILA